MNTQIDTSIPVLTEVIAAPAKPSDVSAITNTELKPESVDTLAVTSAEVHREVAHHPKSASISGGSKSANPALGIRMVSSPTAANSEPSPKTEQQADWQALEQQVREAVLKQLLGRIDFVLEHRVRDNLADVLQVAVLSLTNDIRSGLEKTLSDVISRAVTQEINKIRPPK